MNVEDFGATLTDRINPSLCELTPRTQPEGNWRWWALSWGIKTRSPKAKLWRGLIHFCRSCKFGRYSDNYLLQNTSARYWPYFQRRWQYKSFLTKTPSGRFRSNKWLAVKDSEAIGLQATFENSLNSCHQRWQCMSLQNQLLLKKDSWDISHWTNDAFPDSYHLWYPRKLNFHLMFFWCRKTSILYWFQLFRASRIPLSPLLKCIPLFPLIIYGVPLLLMNLQRAQINESFSRDSVTSTWIARIVKQEKKHHNF